MRDDERDSRISLIAPLVGFAKCAVGAGPTLSVQFVDARSLPSTATDQGGASFDVTGASGVTHLGNGRFAVVLDNSNKLLFLDLAFQPDGSIASFTNAGGLSLDQTLDFEGIAPDGSGGVLLSEETTPGVRGFELAGGTGTGALTIPSVFDAARDNLGFESLTTLDGTGWYANEEALTVDGPRATPTAGTVVRLAEFGVASGVTGRQLAYRVERMHGLAFPFENPGQSGLTDLVLLPNGCLLALERSFALANPVFLSRIYAIDEAGATDVSALPALAGATYTPVTKSLLWSGNAGGNLEGLALGPQLPDGSYPLVGVLDDGDAFSTNQVVVFRLAGVADASCPADCDGSGNLNFDDIDCFVAGFLGGDLIADCDASGNLNFDDIDCFVNSFLAGCP